MPAWLQPPSERSRVSRPRCLQTPKRNRNTGPAGPRGWQVGVGRKGPRGFLGRNQQVPRAASDSTCPLPAMTVEALTFSSVAGREQRGSPFHFHRTSQSAKFLCIQSFIRKGVPRGSPGSSHTSHNLTEPEFPPGPTAGAWAHAGSQSAPERG